MRAEAFEGTDVAIPDEQLISSAAGGDRTAFEELYRRYVPLVYGFLCRYTGSRTEADDLTQDVFVQPATISSSSDSRCCSSWW